MILTAFHDRLNRIVAGSSYAIEERVEVPEGGIYEADLQHDNIDDDTVDVYTGPNRTGDPVGYTLTIPAATPWKRRIRIETEQTVIYISYESSGDQVEAEDINELHNAVTATQMTVTRLEEEITGTASGYTWNRLMGITPESIIEITTQPVSQSVEVGEDATFAVVATGTALSYQWQYVEPGESVWRNFVGETSDELEVTPTAEWNGRQIRVVITNPYGGVAISTTVTLTVTEPAEESAEE